MFCAVRNQDSRFPLGVIEVGSGRDSACVNLGAGYTCVLSF